MTLSHDSCVPECWSAPLQICDQPSPGEPGIGLRKIARVDGVKYVGGVLLTVADLPALEEAVRLLKSQSQDNDEPLVVTPGS